MYGIFDNGQIIGVFTAPMSIRSNQPVFVADTLSLSRKGALRGAQRWEIETAIRPETMDANLLMVHLVTRGYTTPIDVLMPQNIGVIGKRTATAAVIGAAAAGATSVTITAPGGLIPQGTFVRFASHTKVHMTTADISAAGALPIYPALPAAVTASVMNYLDDVILKALYDTDVISGMTYTDGMLQDPGVVRLVEAI